MTVAGRINFAVIVLAFVIPVASSAFGSVQAVIRIWKPSYNAGAAPLLPLFVMWLVASLACVIVIAAIQKR